MRMRSTADEQNKTTTDCQFMTLEGDLTPVECNADLFSMNCIKGTADGM